MNDNKHLQGPSGSIENLGFALGFQHFPWDLANVYEWKIIFDPSNDLWLCWSRMAKGPIILQEMDLVSP